MKPYLDADLYMNWLAILQRGLKTPLFNSVDRFPLTLPISKRLSNPIRDMRSVAGIREITLPLARPALVGWKRAARFAPSRIYCSPAA